MLLALVITPFWTGQSVSAGGTERYRSDRVLLLPRVGAGMEALNHLHAAGGRRVLKSYPSMGGLQVVQLAPGENVGEAVLRYRQSGAVEFAEPDYKLRALATPDDPEFRRGSQWSLENTGQLGGIIGSDISAVQGWETLTSASNIVVAVIDSGIRYSHQDLAPNIWSNTNEVPNNSIDDDRNGFVDDIHGIDAMLNSGDPMDDYGHGTHVAGIIGARGNNGIGIAGVAWQVRLMACRFLGKLGDGDTSDAIQCIDYARRMGAHIINASWGGPDYSASLYTAINNARASGIIFVTAAGNDSSDTDRDPLYPGSFDLNNIVVVGGTGRDDAMDTGYSNFGVNSVDVFAPGTGIYSTWSTWDGAYTSSSGTSMAAPHVAGMLALMKARFPGYATSQLIDRLLNTVDLVPGLAGKCRTGGRVNLARALGPTPAAGFSASKISGEPPLTVAFTDLSFGDISTYRWNFGDASEADTNASPTHTFEYAGTFHVRLDIEGTNGSTNSYSQTIKVAPNYQSTNEAFAWIDPAEMTALELADNGVSAAQPLPFPFKLYGKVYESIYVCANGVLSFESESLNTTSNTRLPNGPAPNTLICPYWDNLNPAAGGTIHAGVTGEEPRRKYVVSWVGVPRNSSGTRLTFQAILEEATGNIVFQYLDVAPNASRGGAKRATVGLENSDGTIGTLYTYNGSPVVIQNNTAVRFFERPFRFLGASITPSARFAGVKDFGFASTNITLRLQNAGNQSVRWSAGSTVTWMEVLQSSGTLAPDESLDVEVQLTAEAYNLAPGSFEGALSVTNLDDGRGTRSLPVILEVEMPRTGMAAEVVGTNTFSGGLGGPFLPEALFAAVKNTGNVPLVWNVATSAEWLMPLAESGELQPGQTETIELHLTDVAAQLESGAQPATLTFTAGEANIELPVNLQVNARIVPQAAGIADGKFQGSFTLPATGHYIIEASEDLVLWWALSSVPEVTGQTLSFEDPEALSARRFYRLVVTQ